MDDRVKEALNKQFDAVESLLATSKLFPSVPATYYEPPVQSLAEIPDIRPDMGMMLCINDKPFMQMKRPFEIKDVMVTVVAYKEWLENGHKPFSYTIFLCDFVRRVNTLLWDNAYANEIQALAAVAQDLIEHYTMSLLNITANCDRLFLMYVHAYERRN